MTAGRSRVGADMNQPVQECPCGDDKRVATKNVLGAFAIFKRHLRTINVASGALLAFFGFLMLTGRIGDLSRWFTERLEDLGLSSLTTI